MEKQALEKTLRRCAAAALALYVLWSAATYLLEGLPRTLLRPDAAAWRLAYAMLANIGIGIALVAWAIRRALRQGAGEPSDYGFGGARRMAVGVAAAALAGYALFRLAHPRPVEATILLNVFAQVWVVSAAEVMVCWALVAGAMSALLRGRGRWAAALVPAAAASLLFALYHFAHSPPFNELRTVVFLAVIGLATSLFWLISRDTIATAVFHNFFGVTGVLSALEKHGTQVAQAEPSAGLMFMALAAAGLLLAARSAALDLRA